MDLAKPTERVLGKLDPRLISGIERGLRAIPWVRRRIEREYEAVLAQLDHTLKPYDKDFPPHTSLPKQGHAHAEILAEMRELAGRERSRWQEGFASGAVYHGDDAHTGFLSQVYALSSQSNPLHADLWPSAAKFEAEVVAMTASMLGAEAAWRDEICGVVSSGGTESILLAMKAYRGWARETKGIKRAQMVVPSSAHAAFDKAADYFAMDLVRVPVGKDCRADVAATRKAISRSTVVVVGSAPSFPHGVVDPIDELSELAQERGVGFHTDACLGGFLLPWAKRLGYSVPSFDFRVPGVTSISVDTHKYGYAAKGSSVVLYRGLALRRYQYFATSEWQGGLYFSPTLAGSRAGALSAMCWAAMVSMGEAGYLEAAQQILAAAQRIKEGIASIAELYVLGNPLFCIAFASDEIDIYRVLDAMTQRQWSLNGLQKPACIHICVTLRHSRPGVAERFIADLKSAVQEVKGNPQANGGMAPVYGMAATLPLRGVVAELLKRYLDRLYRV